MGTSPELDEAYSNYQSWIIKLIAKLGWIQKLNQQGYGQANLYQKFQKHKEDLMNCSLLITNLHEEFVLELTTCFDFGVINYSKGNQKRITKIMNRLVKIENDRIDVYKRKEEFFQEMYKDLENFEVHMCKK